MMNLKTYLKNNQIPQSDFAATLGMSQPSLNAILNGKTNMTVDRAYEIESLTNGDVKVASWLSVG